MDQRGLRDKVFHDLCLKGHGSSLDLPHTQDDQTIFEFTVNEQGQWEHWSNKVCEHDAAIASLT